MAPRLPLATAAAAAALLVLPVGASAATRYTSPTGSGAPGAPCTQSVPCSFQRGVTDAANGDTVQLAADEYNLSGIRVDVTANDLTIQGPGPVGDASTFIPYLMFGDDPGTTAGYRLVFFGTNPVLKNLAITGQGTNALVNANPNAQLSLDRVIINYSDPSGGPSSSGIALAGDNATITNSVIRNEAGGSSSRALEATGTLTGSLVYASNGRAISLDGAYHNAGSCSLTVRNTIAWGASANLRLDGAAACTPVTIDYDYSWIPLTGGAQTGGGLSLGGSSVLSPGSNNLAESPAAVDPSNPGAIILPASSPAINAGCTTGCGTHDYYGRARPIGSANDIGAYEATLIPDVPNGSVSSVTATTAQLSAVVNPNGGQTTYNFQIRRTGAADWETVSGAALPAGTNAPVPVTAEANLLQPETSYQVRVVASNLAGEMALDGLAFRTLATPAPTPSASLSVSSLKAKVGKKGLYFTSRATVNAAGSLSQTATTGSGKKTKTWCRTMTTARTAATYSLKCNLGSKGRRYLKKRSLSLTVKTTLRAATGASATNTRKLTIKRKR